MIEELQSAPDIIAELIDDFIRFIPALIAALVIFFLTLYVASVIRRAVSRALQLRNTNAQTTRLLTKITYWTVLFWGTVLALAQVGFNVTAFLTGLGVVGVTVGFALQDVAKNFVAGVLLLIQRPFYIGESIEVIGFTGSVIAVDLRATEIHTEDGRIVLIPNASVFTNPVTNYSRTGNRRVELKTKVAYDSDLEVVRSAASQAIASVPGLLEKPAPEVNFSAMDVKGIEVMIYYWIDSLKSGIRPAQDAGLAAVKRAFEASGVEMA